MPFANLIAAAESILANVAQNFITQGSSNLVQFAAGEMAKLQAAILPAKEVLASPEGLEAKLQAAMATIAEMEAQIQALQAAQHGPLA
jgi:hypothetical protein